MIKNLLKNNIISKCIMGMFKKTKEIKQEQKNSNYLDKLVKEDNNVSALNFFLIATLFVGVILLFVPIIGMLVDIFFNHTMTINLSDMAMYIGAVAGIFASGGLTSAWTEFSYSKYKISPLDSFGRPVRDDNHNGIPDDEEGFDDCEGFNDHPYHDIPPRRHKNGDVE